MDCVPSPTLKKKKTLLEFIRGTYYILGTRGSLRHAYGNKYVGTEL